MELMYPVLGLQDKKGYKRASHLELVEMKVMLLYVSIQN